MESISVRNARRRFMRKYMKTKKVNKTSFKIGHKKIGGIGKGDKMSESAKQLISKSLQGKFSSNSRRWLGDKAGYVAKHMWIIKHYGNAAKCDNKICIFKNPKRYEWANISGKYKRERFDYIQLCPSCHRKMDMGIKEVIL